MRKGKDERQNLVERGGGKNYEERRELNKRWHCDSLLYKLDTPRIVNPASNSEAELFSFLL